MIAVDTSALVAIAFAEPERDAFMQAIKMAGKSLVSTVSVVETRMVIHGRRGQRAVILMDDLLRLPMFDMVRPARWKWTQPMRRLWPTAKAAATRRFELR
jgi:ribonuclease VapC